jgi:hypothetical protein
MSHFVTDVGPRVVTVPCLTAVLGAPLYQLWVKFVWSNQNGFWGVARITRAPVADKIRP